MDDSDGRKRRVRRVRKSPSAPTTPMPEIEIEEIEIAEGEGPQTPVIETIEAPPVPGPQERGRIEIKDNILMDIVEKIVDKGKAVVISRGKGDEWLIHAEDETEFAMGRSSSWSEYSKEVMSSEYLEWKAKWDKMSSEERHMYAAEEKVEWEHHTEPRIDSMKLSQAVRESLNIEKYKPEYKTRGARSRVKPR